VGKVGVRKSRVGEGSEYESLQDRNPKTQNPEVSFREPCGASAWSRPWLRGVLELRGKGLWPDFLMELRRAQKIHGKMNVFLNLNGFECVEFVKE
jgi:hypothetical protein